MNNKKLFKILLTSGFIAISITNFTGCFYKNTNKDASHISETELKQLEGNVDDVVKAYFKEKYDVQAAVIYQTIAGGVFLGPDPSAEQYYNLTVSIIDGEYYTKCNAEVYGKRVNKKIELYVKNESYYGKIMNDKMIQWIDPYILKNDLNDYMIEYSCTEICFPSMVIVTIILCLLLPLRIRSDHILSTYRIPASPHRRTFRFPPARNCSYALLRNGLSDALCRNGFCHSLWAPES